MTEDGKPEPLGESACGGQPDAWQRQHDLVLIGLQRAGTAGDRSEQEHAADYQRGGRAH